MKTITVIMRIVLMMVVVSRIARVATTVVRMQFTSIMTTSQQETGAVLFLACGAYGGPGAPRGRMGQAWGAPSAYDPLSNPYSGGPHGGYIGSLLRSYEAFI